MVLYISTSNYMVYNINNYIVNSSSLKFNKYGISFGATAISFKDYDTITIETPKGINTYMVNSTNNALVEHMKHLGWLLVYNI